MQKYSLLTILFLCLFLTACSSDDGNTNEESNTCIIPNSLNAGSITETTATLSWNTTETGNFTIEYGPTGFAPGNGVTLGSSTSSVNVSGLIADTDYQFYVKVNCNNGVSSGNAGPFSFTTSAPASCQAIEFVPEIIFVNEDTVRLFWQESDGALSYDLEYGLTGFSLGQGTVFSSSESNVELVNLLPDSQYDYYITSNCVNASSVAQGPYVFTTEPLCRRPDQLFLGQTTFSSISFDWNTNTETAFQIEYGESGFALGTGTTIDTSDNIYEVDGLTPSTTYEFYVRANCGSDGFSEYSDALVATTDSFDLFKGAYRIEQVSNTSFGFDSFDPDGGGVIVTLYDSEDAPTSTVDGVEIGPLQRAFDAVYYPAFGGGNSMTTFVLDFSNGEIVFPENEETGLGCSGEFLLGMPTTGVATYTNETLFEFVFREDVLDACGTGVFNVTVRFVKL